MRFLSEKFGLQELYAQGNSATINPQIYQMLETDADSIAIATLLESISTKIDVYKDKFLDGIGKFIPQCVMVALTTVFFLVERENYTYNIDHAKYLPRDERFWLIIYIFLSKLKNDYKMCRCSQTDEQIIETFIICNNLLGELYMDKDSEKKILFCESDKVFKYYCEILIPLWRDIRNELNPYAVIHLAE